MRIGSCPNMDQGEMKMKTNRFIETKKIEMAIFITEVLYDKKVKITEDHWHVKELMKRNKLDLFYLYLKAEKV